MDYQRDTITGIDIPIYKFQTYLYPILRDAWGLTDDNFNMYGRIYRNQTQDGYVPELFIGGKDYNDTLFDDRLTANSFFGVGETIKVDSLAQTADVFLVFMVDLSKIKPGDDRNDEAAHIDVQRACKNGFYDIRMDGYVTGIDNVFKEYSGFKSKESIKFRDQHPLHCFRINFKMLYNIYDC